MNSWNSGMTLFLRVAHCSVLVLSVGIFPVSAVFGQTVSIYTGDRNVFLNGYTHPFRGPEATVQYTWKREHTDIFAGVGYIVKSWLLGPRQNFYLSSGIQLIGLDSDTMQVTALTLRNRGRFEPRGWQQIQFAAEFDFSPDTTTFEDGQRTTHWAVQMEFLASARTTVALGARQLRVRLQNDERMDIADGAVLGLRFHF